MAGAERRREDHELFGSAWLPTLRAATQELSWLLTRGYPENSALKLVGDRHGLNARQRKGVQRSACTDLQRRSRTAARASLGQLRGETVAVDGFNCLIICESLVAGRVVLRGRDRALRDLASVHGTWRRGRCTPSAMDHLAGALERATLGRVDWVLDRPVSNSGRLAALLRDRAEQRGLPWHVELVERVDDVLAEREAAVATADAWLLDHCRCWVDLPHTVAEVMDGAWIVDLGESP